MSAKCSVWWCDETAYHVRHRKYVRSTLSGLTSGGVVGVNVAERASGSVVVELTVTADRQDSSVCLLAPYKADEVGRALLRAASRAQRVDGDAARGATVEPSD